jgi:peptide/nickel transport system substrate-binding protein
MRTCALATRARPKVALLTALAAVCLAAAGCAGSSDAATGPGGSGAGTLNWEWELPTSWDPVESTAGWDVHVLSLVYASITSLDAKGDAIPGLASSWRYAPDGRSVTFTLRPNLKFSDGTALDANAVKASIERGRDQPDSKIASQLGEITKVVVTGPTRFELDLSREDYQIPLLLAGKTGMVVSPTAFGHDAAALSTKPVGAGPFTLSEYVPDSHANLVRDKGYWDAKDIHVDNFTVQDITQPQEILAALESGQVNVAEIPGSLAKSAKAAGFTINAIPSLTVAELDLKNTVAPYDDPRVVEAINYALDRQALINTTQFGYGTPAYQPFPKGYVGYVSQLADLYPRNVAKARQLLAEAGHPNGISITLTSTADSPRQPSSEQIQAQLAQAGINATIQQVPSDQFSNIDYVQKKASLANDSTAGRESPVQMLEVLYDTAGLMNTTKLEPQPVSAAFARVHAVPLDSPEYPGALRAAVTTATQQELVHVYLYSYPRILATSPKVTGLPFDLVQQRFEGVRVSG